MSGCASVGAQSATQTSGATHWSQIATATPFSVCADASTLKERFASVVQPVPSHFRTASLRAHRRQSAFGSSGVAARSPDVR